MALTKQADIIGNNRTEDYIGAPVHEHEMSIGPEVTSMIIQQLTDLYTDPIEAMVRETVSNAIDATVRARNLGQDASDVEIVRPTRLSPVLSIIDHGTGMTQDELEKYFSDYGNSTKLNDFTAVGSKGLGAKAMLAYTPVANIITVKDGVRVVAQMERGEHRNVLKTLSVDDTTGTNGTTISVTIRPVDIDAVNNVISRCAKYASESTPIIINGRAHSIADNYYRMGSIVIGAGNDGSSVMGNLWVRASRVFEPRLMFPSQMESELESIRTIDWANEDGPITTASDGTTGPMAFDYRHFPASEWYQRILVASGINESSLGWSYITDYVKNNVSVTLNGWNYSLEDDVEDDSSCDLNMKDYLDRTRNAFVVEIVPGLVDFPASRDEIKRNRRFDELLGRLVTGLRMGDDPFDAVHLWDGIEPKPVRVQILDAMCTLHSMTDSVAPWLGMKDSWPEAFRSLDNDGPKFSGVLSFTSEITNPVNHSKASRHTITDVKASCMYSVTCTGMLDNVNRNTYAMEPVKNDPDALKTWFTVGINDGNRRPTGGMYEFLSSLCSDFLVRDSVLSTCIDDSVSVSPYRDGIGRYCMDLSTENPPLDYDFIRSVPLKYVMSDSCGVNVPFGVTNYWCNNYDLTIVQGEFHTVVQRERAMGLLWKLVGKRAMNQGDKPRTYLFYLVDGELDRDSLAEVEGYFSRFAKKTPLNHDGRRVFSGVTTYDDIAKNLGVTNHASNGRRNTRKTRKSVSCRTLSTDNDRSRWVNAMDIACTVSGMMSINGSRHDMDPSMFKPYGTELEPFHGITDSKVKASDIIDNGDIALFIRADYKDNACNTLYDLSIATCNVFSAFIDDIPWESWRGRRIHIIPMERANDGFLSAFADSDYDKAFFYNGRLCDMQGGHHGIKRIKTVELEAEEDLITSMMDSLLHDDEVTDKTWVFSTVLASIGGAPTLRLDGRSWHSFLQGRIPSESMVAITIANLIGGGYTVRTNPAIENVHEWLVDNAHQQTDPCLRRLFEWWAVAYADLCCLYHRYHEYTYGYGKCKPDHNDGIMGTHDLNVLDSVLGCLKDDDTTENGVILNSMLDAWAEAIDKQTSHKELS